MERYAEIAVSETVYSFDMLFSYKVPDNMSVSEGCRVLVPFGRGNSRRLGIVVRISDEKPESSVKMKSVISTVDEEPVISHELLKLAEYMRDRTFCTYFDALRVMLPPAMRVRTQEHFRFGKNFKDHKSLSDGALNLLDSISLIEPKKLTDFMEGYISANGRKFPDELCDAGALISDNVFRQALGDTRMRMVRLSNKYCSNPADFDLTPKQKTVADFLIEVGTASVKETAYMCGVTESVVKRLISSGGAEEYECEISYSPEVDENSRIDPDSVVLSEEQQNAYDTIMSGVNDGKPAVYLLNGVTGSGKTSVFEKLINEVTKTGKRAMLLIPEISLTPQILSRFRSLFGSRAGVIHSGLSLRQRLEEYKRIKSGEADIVIGTRSAIFAPLSNIGIIIMDEEGDRSYKSASTPRYSTHDIATQRVIYNNAVLLLASATPSIESTYMCQLGRYRLVEMKNRYGNNPLPEVTIADMRIEREEGNFSEFSRILAREIELNLERGEQSILLLNRRGYHTIISCVDCQKPLHCPNCSVPLTYHKKNNRMMCHYCGFSDQPPERCPSCGSERLKSMGFGTQKLEEELGDYFPMAKILRMDADTAVSRQSYEKNFADFREGKYDIMAGTQMISKGLDFPNVTLVGVLSVDKSLYSGDFRSYEQTFSLVTQVVGRGGRGGKRGRAILQTFMPDHYVMRLASRQDYWGFYKEETSIRRVMVFPPFCDMCVFGFSAIDEETVQKGAYSVLSLMRVRLRELVPKTPVKVLGPVKCSYLKIGGKYRYRIIMKFKNTAQMRGFIENILKEGSKLREMKDVSLYVDINGDIGL